MFQMPGLARTDGGWPSTDVGRPVTDSSCTSAAALLRARVPQWQSVAILFGMIDSPDLRVCWAENGHGTIGQEL
jgi:hypothetical protein